MAVSALVGCAQETKPATQLILVVDTNIDRLESIEFRVEAANVAAKTATAPRDPTGKPVYLTLFREQGPLGPLNVSAIGMRGTNTLVSRTHTVWFSEGETLVVPLHLVESCIGRACGQQTCGEMSCTRRELDTESLLPWTGEPPALAVTQCDQAMTDLMADPKNCGACGEVCPVPGGLQHTVATCSQGACNTACDALYGNCDNRAENGCEQSLTMQANCGACDRRCANNQRCSPTGVCVEK